MDFRTVVGDRQNPTFFSGETISKQVIGGDYYLPKGIMFAAKTHSLVTGPFSPKTNFFARRLYDVS